MAFDFTKLNFFSRLDARARVAVLFGGIMGFVAIVYFIVQAFSNGQTVLGPSRVAGAPQGLQSIPGSTNLTTEYKKALLEANKQTAQAAQISGSSAVPTLINFGNQQAPNTTSCNIICSDQTANVKDNLHD